jgi:hypothetical protein
LCKHLHPRGHQGTGCRAQLASKLAPKLAETAEQPGKTIGHIRIGSDGRPLILPEVKIAAGQGVQVRRFTVL